MFSAWYMSFSHITYEIKKRKIVQNQILSGVWLSIVIISGRYIPYYFVDNMSSIQFSSPFHVEFLSR